MVPILTSVHNNMQSGRNQHSESMVAYHSLEVSVSFDFSCLMEKYNFFVMFNMNNKDEPYITYVYGTDLFRPSHPPSEWLKIIFFEVTQNKFYDLILLLKVYILKYLIPKKNILWRSLCKK